MKKLIPPIVRGDIAAKYFSLNHSKLASSPGKATILELDTSSFLTSPKALLENVLVTPGSTYGYLFAKQQIKEEQFRTIDFLIKIISLQSLIENFRVEEEDEEAFGHLDIMMIDLRKRQVKELKTLTNHIWVEECSDTRDIYKIRVDYPFAEGFEDQSLDCLLGKNMREAGEALLRVPD